MFAPTPEQMKAVMLAYEGLNLLIKSVIGSGKTSFLEYLCENILRGKNVLYLTYNKLLRLDAERRIQFPNVLTTNYHKYAYLTLKRTGNFKNITTSIDDFLACAPKIGHYDVLLIDEYQDIDSDLAAMLQYIKDANPGIQIIAVGDMHQRMYDCTTLDAEKFMKSFLRKHKTVKFTKCFRLSKEHANFLGDIWNIKIDGVNEDCRVDVMTFGDAMDVLLDCDPKDVLCVGNNYGLMTSALNYIEERKGQKFSKNNVYCTIRSGERNEPLPGSMIMTTYDSCKGLERDYVFVFDFTPDNWFDRASKPYQNIEILKNIFCVASSRGKKRIIYVLGKGQTLLTAEDIKQTKPCQETRKQRYEISNMFSHKYKEDVKNCMKYLAIRPIARKNTNDIRIQKRDRNIDLSPCVGIYQSAFFFANYDIDEQIDKYIKQHDLPIVYTDAMRTMPVDWKVLYLTSLETRQQRYIKQVSMPYITSLETKQLQDRLREVFTGNETVEQECFLNFEGKNETLTAYGRADVVVADTVYELKFVQSMSMEHFLQCACYIAAMNMRRGILWNTQKNEMFEIRITDKKAFLNAVAVAITKGHFDEQVATNFAEQTKEKKKAKAPVNKARKLKATSTEKRAENKTAKTTSKTQSTKKAKPSAGKRAGKNAGLFVGMLLIHHTLGACIVESVNKNYVQVNFHRTFQNDRELSYKDTKLRKGTYVLHDLFENGIVEDIAGKKVSVGFQKTYLLDTILSDFSVAERASA